MSSFATTSFTPWTGLLGGALIGLSSGLLLLLAGRIAGISGIAAGLLSLDPKEVGWRLHFVGGLLVGAVLFSAVTGDRIPVDLQMGLPWMIAGGFLVGFGTRMASGCTAGHGISGLARFSRRSLVATTTFFGAAILTVFVVRHVWS